MSLYQQKIEEGCTEVYAYWYAFAYENASKEGRSLDFAHAYADKLAEEFSENVGRVDIPDDDELFRLANFKVLAYMFVWEYAQVNPLKNESSLSHIFQREALDLYLSKTRKGETFTQADFQNVLTASIKKLQ